MTIRSVLLVESRVNFHGPRCISTTLQRNSVAAFSRTTEADGDGFKDENNLEQLKNGSLQFIWHNPRLHNTPDPKCIREEVLGHHLEAWSSLCDLSERFQLCR